MFPAIASGGPRPPDPAARRPLGQTGLAVTPICAGTSPLGSWAHHYGHDTSVEVALATLRAVLAGPFNYLDTSADYSAGEAERRIGLAIREAGGVPAGFVVQTKVDPDPVTGRFDGAAVRRSFEGSLGRLGMDRVPVLHFHDPERIPHAQALARGGPVQELAKIKAEGLADHLGVAGGPADLLSRYLDTGLFDVLISHNRWTLADRTADALFDKAAAAGVGIVNAAPFGGGSLARGTATNPTYCYAPMPGPTLQAVRRVEAICAAAGVPLGAAALQFSLRDPRIGSTIVGMARPERVEQALAWASWPIEDAVWRAVLDASGLDAGLPNHADYLRLD
ncbi:MAG: aldo/keto reductase [Bifidobacteriaceae bacterium]|jgi:D-threo-aldose 1-dehydrogenase|nr:aldo/keto reductase [Bifidobacteriaceae bacterium]